MNVNPSIYSQKNNNIQLLLIILFLINEYLRPLLFARLKVVFIIQILFIIFLYSHKNKRTNKANLFSKLWMFLMIEMFLHIFIAHNNFWALEFFKTTLSYWLFYLMVVFFIDTKIKAKLILFCFIFFNALCAIKGIQAGGMVPNNGFMADENDFALTMNIALPIAIYSSFTVKSWKRILIWAFAVMMFLGCVYSLSRGGMVGLASLIFFIWILSKRKLLSLLLICFAVTVFVFNMPSDYKNEVDSLIEDSYKSGTGRERIEFWKVSTRVFMAHPFLGVGQGNLPYRISEFQGEEYWKRGIGGRAVHSLYFTLLAELGTVGVVLVGLMVRKAFKYCSAIYKNSTDEEAYFAKGLLAGFFAFLVTAAFLSVLYYPHLWILLTLINMLWANFHLELRERTPSTSWNLIQEGSTR